MHSFIHPMTFFLSSRPFFRVPRINIHTTSSTSEILQIYIFCLFHLQLWMCSLRLPFVLSLCLPIVCRLSCLRSGIRLSVRFSLSLSVFLNDLHAGHWEVYSLVDLSELTFSSRFLSKRKYASVGKTDRHYCYWINLYVCTYEWTRAREKRHNICVCQLIGRIDKKLNKRNEINRWERKIWSAEKFVCIIFLLPWWSIFSTKTKTRQTIAVIQLVRQVSRKEMLVHTCLIFTAFMSYYTEIFSRFLSFHFIVLLPSLTASFRLISFFHCPCLIEPRQVEDLYFSRSISFCSTTSGVLQSRSE